VPASAALTCTLTLTCTRCGSDWQRPVQPGRRPRLCPDCAPHPEPRRRAPRPRPVRTTPPSVKAKRLDTTTPGYRLARDITTYRLAIEEATSALKIGRPHDALAALERVAAPTRSSGRRGRISPVG
jgi:hypothetical protein